MTTLDKIMDAKASAALARLLIACVVPLLESPARAQAQPVLATIRLLAPASDLRLLQALTHFRLGQFVEAMALWNEFDDMSSRALVVLCLRAIGEASWWGAAQAIHDSGDAAAIAVLEPWTTESGDPQPEDRSLTESACAAATDSLYAFLPLRA